MSTDNAKLVARCGALIDGWKVAASQVEENRDAHELDITAVEARQRGIVAGNETYIGRRVIAGNIQRELPVFIQYLAGSYRHVSAISVDGQTPLPALAKLESEFTTGFRVGNWLEQHIQTLSSFALHGRGVFMVISTPQTVLNTTPVYVPPEDFIFPLEARDIQKCPLLGVRYVISEDQYKKWMVDYQWNAETAKAILDATADPDRATKMYEVHLMFMKVAGAVKAFWFNRDQNKIMRDPYPYDAGFKDAMGNAVPAPDYPIFPVYYKITENPQLIERKGRAHDDMHDQEALTMGWSAAVNGCLRASEIYVSLKDRGLTENPEIAQTTFVMDPGKILKQPIDFNHADWPDASMLQTMNALKTENASSAGQIDFAAQARKDSRKTAKELSLAQEQTAASNSVPLTMFASGYKAMIQFMWTVLQANIASGYNQTFMASAPEARAALAGAKISLAPSGDVDFVEREEKLKLYTQYYQMFASTAVGQFFLKKILELAFPIDYPQLEPLLTDNTKQIGAAMLQLLMAVPTESLPPEALPKLQEIIAEGQRAFGQPEGQNAPNQSPAGTQGQPGNGGQP